MFVVYKRINGVESITVVRKKGIYGIVKKGNKKRGK